MAKIKIVTEGGDELLCDADRHKLNSNNNGNLIFVFDDDYGVTFVAQSDKVKWAGVVGEGLSGE